MFAYHWKNNAGDLRDRAHRVTTMAASSSYPTSARQAAKVLLGIVRHVAATWSKDIMQRACAALARHEASWASVPLAKLPLENGAVPEPLKLIALVARGLLPMAGADNVRDALSFWAIEDDPATWTSVTHT